MRVESHTVGSIMHVIKRGARGMNIVEDQMDRWNFVRDLYILNDSYSDENWHRDTANLGIFERPDHWPERKPLVRILAWTLLPNHFHILFQEIEEGGITKFMQRLCGSMTLCFNSKYKGQGSIFQGSYRGNLVENDEYLRYLTFYILVKNVFEVYTGGISKALIDFDKAWEWALLYPFSSLSTQVIKKESPIINDSERLIENALGAEFEFKEESYKMLLTYLQRRKEDLEELMLENW